MRHVIKLLTVVLLVSCAPGPTDPAPCIYPEPTEPFDGIGDVIPPLSWRGYEDHQRVDVDLQAFHCGELWPEFDSILFVLVAEWCPECPNYSSFVGGLADELEFNGAKLVFVDMETRTFELPSSESADNYVSNHTDAGVRVGERDGSDPGFITDGKDRGLWLATPNAFFIRKRDMQVVTRQQDGSLVLPFVKIAQGIELDWSDPDNPPFVNNCTREEESEPNDAVVEAGVLRPGDVVEGGICNEGPDIYRIEAEGAWTLNLEFDQFTADLDIFLVDDQGEIRRFANGEPFGAFSDTDDELLAGAGPTNIMIVAKDERSSPYRLSLE